MTCVTYTWARNHLGVLLKEVAENRETVIIRHRNDYAVAALPAEELRALIEVANGSRIAKASERSSKEGDGPVS